MTGLPHHDDSRRDADQRDAAQRDFHREQLSAMMDGALSADEARFLLRRMQHDDELADCWERWQYFGDAMRGHCGRALPADFSRRVGRAIADDIALAQSPQGRGESATRRGFVRWGTGGALAASVALAALIGSRIMSPADDSAPTPAQVAAVASSGTQPPEVPVRAPEPGPAAGVYAPAVSAALVAAAASASSREQRDAIRSARPRIIAADQALATASAAAAPAAHASSVPQAVHAAGAAVAASASFDSAAVDPFGPGLEVSAKPWPRALLPEAAAVGGLNVDYGTVDHSFHPFQPRIEAPMSQPPESGSVAEGDSPTR